MEVLQTSALPLGYGAAVRKRRKSSPPGRGETRYKSYPRLKREASSFRREQRSRRSTIARVANRLVDRGCRGRLRVGRTRGEMRLRGFLACASPPGPCRTGL